MKFYVSLFVILPALAFAQPVDAPYQAYVEETLSLLQADAPVQVPGEASDGIQEAQNAPQTHATSVESQVRNIALKHGIDPDKYLALILCENKELDPNQQSNLRYSFSDPKRGIVRGERERSFGLLQAHAPDFPELTMQQMTSAEWSLNWGAEHIKAGRTWMWKTCSRVAGF